MTTIDAVRAAIAGQLTVGALPPTTGPLHAIDPVIVERMEAYAHLIQTAQEDPAQREFCLRQALEALEAILARGQELARQRRASEPTP
jgi:hypothetical protein